MDLLPNSHLNGVTVLVGWPDFSPDFFVLGFNDTSTLVDHFVSSPREK